LSSYSGHQNYLAYFNENEWKRLETNFNLQFIPRIFIDKHDYVWVQGSNQGDYSGYFVYDGKKWHRSEEGQIPEVFKKRKSGPSKQHLVLHR